MASETPTRTPNPFVVFLGIAAAFAVVALILGGSLALPKPVNEVEQKRAAQRLATREKLDAEAAQRLNSLGWVDKAKGTVHVPITTAMTMVVAELAAKKPAPSSVKVEPPLPMPVIDPKSAEPPPPALPSSPQGADTIRFAPPATEIPAAPAAPVPAPALEKPAEPAPAPAVPPAPALEKPAEAAPAPAAPAPSPVPLEKPAEPAPAPTK